MPFSEKFFTYNPPPPPDPVEDMARLAEIYRGKPIYFTEMGSEQGDLIQQTAAFKSNPLLFGPYTAQMDCIIDRIVDWVAENQAMPLEGEEKWDTLKENLKDRDGSYFGPG